MAEEISFYKVGQVIQGLDYAKIWINSLEEQPGKHRVLINIQEAINLLEKMEEQKRSQNIPQKEKIMEK